MTKLNELINKVEKDVQELKNYLNNYKNGLLIVSNNIQNYQELINCVESNVKVFIYDASQPFNTYINNLKEIVSCFPEKLLELVGWVFDSANDSNIKFATDYSIDLTNKHNVAQYQQLVDVINNLFKYSKSGRLDLISCNLAHDENYEHMIKVLEISTDFKYAYANGTVGNVLTSSWKLDIGGVDLLDTYFDKEQIEDLKVDIKLGSTLYNNIYSSVKLPPVSDYRIGNTTPTIMFGNDNITGFIIGYIYNNLGKNVNITTAYSNNVYTTTISNNSNSVNFKITCGSDNITKFDSDGNALALSNPTISISTGNYTLPTDFNTNILKIYNGYITACKSITGANNLQSIIYLNLLSVNFVQPSSNVINIIPTSYLNQTDLYTYSQLCTLYDYYGNLTGVDTDGNTINLFQLYANAFVYMINLNSTKISKNIYNDNILSTPTNYSIPLNTQIFKTYAIFNQAIITPSSCKYKNPFVISSSKIPFTFTFNFDSNTTLYAYNQLLYSLIATC
jgi:hypothetical protein